MKKSLNFSPEVSREAGGRVGVRGPVTATRVKRPGMLGGVTPTSQVSRAK